MSTSCWSRFTGGSSCQEDFVTSLEQTRRKRRRRKPIPSRIQPFTGIHFVQVARKAPEESRVARSKFIPEMKLNGLGARLKILRRIKRGFEVANDANSSMTAPAEESTRVLQLANVAKRSIWIQCHRRKPQKTMPAIAQATKADVILAYRHLYQQGLHAIRFSKPARYTLRDRLREAFHTGNPKDFDLNRIRNTLQFLRGAARPGSVEHRVLRTLLLTWHWEKASRRYNNTLKSRQRETGLRRQEEEVRLSAYDQFNFLIRMLNESMGLCIR